MSRIINVAAIQMDVAPAPTSQRLARAGRLIDQAAQAGADLVVLPEVFNTGYAYTDENYCRAETLTGLTVTWMKDTAARLNIHLAGTLLLLDNVEVYNALLLVAPDGRIWRYDKTYPWGWERAYFRDSNRVTVARTDLGDVGMLICWDVAHPGLWRQYAGRVDMMLVCSSPPDLSNPTYYFPEGERVTLDDMGPLMARLKDVGHRIWGTMFDQQTAWLGVPAVNTVAVGTFKSALPNPVGTLLSFLPLAPWLAKYLPQAHKLHVTSSMLEGCKVVDANGQALAALSQEQGESFALAEVILADEKPHPQGLQPAAPIPWLTYLASDVLLPLITLPAYRKGLRRAWGKDMAPPDALTRRWMPLLGAALALSAGLGVLIGALWGRRKSTR